MRKGDLLQIAVRNVRTGKMTFYDAELLEHSDERNLERAYRNPYDEVFVSYRPVYIAFEGKPVEVGPDERETVVEAVEVTVTPVSD
jgi:hypothetical protein